MVIEWLGLLPNVDGRRQTSSRHIQATETGWPCSTGFTNSFRRLGGSLAHVLELVAERRGGGGLMRPGTGGRSGFEGKLHNPANDMPAYSEAVLSDKDIVDIYAFVQSLPGPRSSKDISILNK